MRARNELASECVRKRGKSRPGADGGKRERVGEAVTPARSFSLLEV